MKINLKYSVFMLVLFISLLLTGCGGGGGSTTASAAATTPVDLSGTWSGTVSGNVVTYVVTQNGNSLTLTRTPAVTGVTYTGIVNGNSAIVTEYGNNVTMSTATWSYINSTTSNLVLNSCVAVPGFTCGAPNGTTIIFTKSTVASTLSFPLQAGYHTLAANGWAKSYTIAGTCTGSGNRASAPATTATTFEGSPAMSGVSTINFSFSNCTPASIAQTETLYYDTNYNPVGFNSVGVNYGIYLRPASIPVSVSVGGTGIIGTKTLYTDSTKATGNGRIDSSYVVTADTSTTAIVTLIAKIYNSIGTLTATEQDAWRVASSGALTPVSTDIQYAYTSTTHLIITYN